MTGQLTSKVMDSKGIVKKKRKSGSISRSKSGCLSCKKLRIRCDQAKPRCEYCVSTGRECIYPINLVTVEFKQPQPQEISVNKFGYNSINQFNLNNATSQLGISKFELRLLYFFNTHCRVVNDAINSIWTEDISTMFLQSELIRNSVYSYASLNLFPLCKNLNQLRIQDEVESTLKFKDRVGSLSYMDESKSLVSNSDDLYVKTTNYFINTLSGKNQLIDKLQNDAQQQISARMILAQELVVSSLLIISFLAIHSHRLLPLVSFDKSEPDFISICKGMQQSIMLFHPEIPSETFEDLIGKEPEARIPTAKESKIPIIANLLQDLHIENENQELTNEEYTTLYEALELLQSCVYQSMCCGYLFPLFRWVPLSSTQFHQCVYEKKFFAVRLLYVFSTLAVLTKYQKYQNANIWLDFIHWYRRYNYQLFSDWKYSMDKSLYFLVVHSDFQYIEGKYANMQDFDPEFLESIISIGDIVNDSLEV